MYRDKQTVNARIPIFAFIQLNNGLNPLAIKLKKDFKSYSYVETNILSNFKKKKSHIKK